MTDRPLFPVLDLCAKAHKRIDEAIAAAVARALAEHRAAVIHARRCVGQRFRRAGE
jgi:hypothetical protein